MYFQRKNDHYTLSSNVSFGVKKMPYKVQPAKFPEGSIAVSVTENGILNLSITFITLISEDFVIDAQSGSISPHLIRVLWALFKDKFFITLLHNIDIY